ncbi:MAG: hypothetical protein SVN78_07205 [Deferribacterota bacterium]|nr:hypothetical protein [Deferribacterota bacterium]
MCGGLIFNNKDELIRVYFPVPYSTIYYIDSKGVTNKAFWGIRGESEFSDLIFPKTGWAKIESIKSGYWNRFNPEKVYIPAYKYMEKDPNGNSHWFELKDNEFIMGLLVKSYEHPFVYVITIPSPKDYAHIHDRWVFVVEKDNLDKGLSITSG